MARITAPAPISRSSSTLTYGAYLYPKPPDSKSIANTDPSEPITGFAFAPIPPPPKSVL